MHRPHVLISREVDENLAALAKGVGWSLTGVRTLDIQHVPCTFRQAESTRECWVVTSRNAVAATADAMDKHGEVCTYVGCVGKTTSGLLAKMGIDVDRYADSARKLGPKLRHLDIDAVRFFCGNNRRDEIAEIARQMQVAYLEQIVYRSQAVYPVLPQQDWDGLICTSPLSARSLFKKNRLNADLPVMTMGPSTREALAALGMCDVTVSSRPSYDVLFPEFDKYMRNA